MVATTNAGRSAQNLASTLKFKPGQEPLGKPIRGSDTKLLVSYRPNGTDTAVPTTIAMMGAHRRNWGGARRIRSTPTTNVAAAAQNAPTVELPSGMSVKDAKAIGITVAAINMMTVPETTGVKMRRSQDSLAASTN